MAITVPPVPYKTPVTSRDGIMHPVWAAWFRELFLRIGGPIALSNEELETAVDVNLTSVEADISALESSVSSLQSSVTSLQTRVTALEGGLNVGPNL